jgi:predicted nucleic-acid-binding protein
MKVFLDTNVLASAAATRGLCADLLREVFASHELFISEQVVIELRRVLQLKFGVNQELVEDFIELLVFCLANTLTKSFDLFQD